MRYIFYFLLGTLLHLTYVYGPTWLFICQACTTVFLIFVNIKKEAFKQHLRYLKLEHEKKQKQKDRLYELNPHKWGK